MEILIIIGSFVALGVGLYIAEKIKPGFTDKFEEEMKRQNELKKAQHIHLNSRELENELNKIRNAGMVNRTWRK